MVGDNSVEWVMIVRHPVREREDSEGSELRQDFASSG
jgi:hypothetical protein